MTIFARYFLPITLLMTLNSASAWAGGRPEPKTRPLVTVRVYDYANLRPATLKQAEKEAARVFRIAGIDTIWLHCALTQEELAANPVCDRRFGKDSLVLRVIPESKARVLARHPSEFGVAYQSERGGFGTHAYVFSHRAVEIADAGVTSEAVVLGHVLAHEMGHLLLGVGHHFHRGLMMANWRAEQLQAAARALFLFTPKKAARMQSNLLKRSQAATAPQTEQYAAVPPGGAKGDDPTDSREGAFRPDNAQETERPPLADHTALNETTSFFTTL